MSKLLIVTRDFWPKINGLSDHTALAIRCLHAEYEEIDVICESDPQRDACTVAQGGTIFEYGQVSEMRQAVERIMSSHRYDAVLFEYVPHMWGRAGVAIRASLLPWRITSKFRVPVISYLHELHYDWAWQPKRLVLSLIHRLQLLAIGRYSDALVVTNDSRERALRRYWKGKVVRIPAGNVSGRRNLDARAKRFEWPYIAWFGTFSEDQRIDHLATLFLEAVRWIPDLRLVIVGAYDVTAASLKQLRERFASGQMSDRLVELGFASDDLLSDVLSGSLANVVVYASGPSGRRGVVAACLRSGRMLLALRGAETDPELMDHPGVSLAMHEDLSEWVHTLRRLVAEPRFKERAERDAQSLYETMFSDTVVGAKLSAVCRSVRVVKQVNS